jgi:two-component system response regulator LytT
VNILLVEDELSTARALQRLLNEVRPTAQVLAHVETVADTVAWLRENPTPDLLLMDIQLGDGTSFEVFQQVAVSCPVIFLTAYDEYALQAFQANGIEYLLKPLTRAKLERGLEKFEALRQHYAAPAAGLPSLPTPDFTEFLRTVQQLSSATSSYKSSWLIPHKTKLIPVAATEVAYFTIRNRLVFLTTLTGQEYTMDVSLDELESQVNPSQFFRANRQVLFTRTSVAELEPYYNGRLLVHLKPPAREDVVISKPRVTELKDWLSA